MYLVGKNLHNLGVFVSLSILGIASLKSLVRSSYAISPELVKLKKLNNVKTADVKTIR